MIKRIVAAIKREPIAVSIGLTLFIHVILESQSRAQLMEEVGQQLQEARSINHQSRELLEQAQTQMDDADKLLQGTRLLLEDAAELIGLADRRLDEIGLLVFENDKAITNINEAMQRSQKEINRHNAKMEKQRHHCQKARDDYRAKNDFTRGNPAHILTRKQRKHHRRECVRRGGSWKG